MMTSCEYRYPLTVPSPSSDTPSMADSLLDDDDDDEDDEEEILCESNDPLNNSQNQNKNDYGKVKTWRAVVHDCSNGEGAELTLYSPTEKSQTTMLTTTTTTTPQKLNDNFLSASCLGTCLFQDTISEVTSMIQTAKTSVSSSESDATSPNESPPQNLQDGVDHNSHLNDVNGNNSTTIESHGDQYYYSWAVLCGNYEVHKQIMPSPQKLPRRKPPRNRSGNVKSRSTRLWNLQKNLRPFEGGESIELDSKAISFQIDRSSTFIRSRTNTSSFVPAHIASMTNHMIESVPFCGEADPKTIQFFNDTSQDDDLCYDSDPGDTKEYRDFKRKSLRRVESRMTNRNRSRWNFDDSMVYETSYHQFLEPEISHKMKVKMRFDFPMNVKLCMSLFFFKDSLFFFKCSFSCFMNVGGYEHNFDVDLASASKRFVRRILPHCCSRMGRVWNAFTLSSYTTKIYVESYL